MWFFRRDGDTAGMALGCAVFLLAACGAFGDYPFDITLIRQAPEAYVPGEPLEITLNIFAGTTEGLTAIGVYETIPPGWEYVSLRAVNSEPPSIGPAAGEIELLQFAYITIPSFPITFAYTVMPPADAQGTVYFSGQAEYRAYSGAMISAPIITQVAGPALPIITLLGDNPLVLEQGIPYVEPGWTAMGPDGEDLDDAVAVTGTVDFMTPGEYTLTYSLSTESGLTAQSVDRVVQVIESPCKGPLCCYGVPGASGGVSPGDAVAGLVALLVLMIWPRRSAKI